MTFNISKITHKDSLKIGSNDAPLKIVEYVNLRCPYSKKFEEEVAPSLNEYIKNGKVQRILKHFDKSKYPLEVGNILNQYVDYKTPEATYELVKKLFAEQDIWGKSRLAEIPHIAEEYGLVLQPDNQKQSARISEEVEAINVTTIPTIFVGNDAFVGTVGIEELLVAVEMGLK